VDAPATISLPPLRAFCRDAFERTELWNMMYDYHNGGVSRKSPGHQQSPGRPAWPAQCEGTTVIRAVAKLIDLSPAA